MTIKKLNDEQLEETASRIYERENLEEAKASLEKELAEVNAKLNLFK